MERLNYGDEKIVFGTNLRILDIGLMKCGRVQQQGNKKIFQYCTDPSGQEILFFRALQGHSGRNPIDPSLQDNVLIPRLKHWVKLNFSPRRQRNFCFCLCTVIELIVVCRRVVSERSLWK